MTPRAVHTTNAYGLLQKYLQDRYSNTVVLSFEQIEDLLGFKLPDEEEHAIAGNIDRLFDLVFPPRCPACGAIGYRHDRYCSCCGSPMTSHCNHCGAASEHPLANYCTRCGMRLHDGRHAEAGRLLGGEERLEDLRERLLVVRAEDLQLADEPRYAEVSREMFATGEDVFKSKDLYVWCANASDGVVTAHPYLKGEHLQDIKGKKDWLPYERAGFLYRRHKHHAIPLTVVAQELGISDREARTKNLGGEVLCEVA